MLNKKLLTDIFLRKEVSEKKERIPIYEEVERIDESYIDCKISWDPENLSLVRINAFIAKGRNSFMKANRKGIMFR